MSSSVIEKDGKLYLQTKDPSSINILVDKLINKGWKQVKISGDEELKRAFILECKEKGINIVDNKLNTEKLRLPASEIVLQYEKNIIPKLKKDFDKTRQARKDKKIYSSELDRVYNINTNHKELDDYFFKIKDSLNKAQTDLKLFKSLGDKEIEVRQMFDNRYVLTDSLNLEKDIHSLRKKLRS